MNNEPWKHLRENNVIHISHNYIRNLYDCKKSLTQSLFLTPKRPNHVRKKLTRFCEERYCT